MVKGRDRGTNGAYKKCDQICTAVAGEVCEQRGVSRRALPRCPDMRRRETGRRRRSPSASRVQRIYVAPINHVDLQQRAIT